MKIQFLPDDGDGIPEPGGDDGPLKDITAISLTDGVDEAWAGFTVPWTPPADDDFFVGWQALWSEAGETGICLDDIEISGAPPLPVELSSLSANYNNGSIKLNWVTQTEINNYGFEIERKSGIKSHNSQWEKIAFIQGYGNSNSPKNYAYEDKDFASGYNSYRLKQIDSDGSFEYSKSIVINADAIPGNYALEQNYPNPFNPSTTISFTLPKAGFTTLKIYDMLGMEVASLVDEEKPAGRFEIEFEGKFLSAGVYFYELKTINFSQTKKLILMK
ncbi:MAG: T9SS type A sorting domain-containing protein [Ignavibacteriae bacterium]|nr:T9SS C-terminal target domain-containing protein [Ignavibacteriota bacterium]NOH00287.1 T9SS type A sorting domain-containing protein [Ignavibacteriota bacterium]